MESTTKHNRKDDLKKEVSEYIPKIEVPFTRAIIVSISSRVIALVYAIAFFYDVPYPFY